MSFSQHTVNLMRTTNYVPKHSRDHSDCEYASHVKAGMLTRPGVSRPRPKASRPKPEIKAKVEFNSYGL